MDANILKKAIADAVRADESAYSKWKNAGGACASAYVTKPQMESDRDALAAMIIAAIPGAEKAINKKIERGDKSQEANLARLEKIAAQKKVSGYCARLLAYAFPPETKEKSAQTMPQTMQAEPKAETASQTAQMTAKAEKITDQIASMIEVLGKMETAPEGVNLVQAIKNLRLAASFLKGI